MIVYHIYNQVRPNVWKKSGAWTIDKPESGRWIEHEVGSDDKHLQSVEWLILKKDPICIGTARDGSEWEMFIDACYFDMVCVKRVDDRDFNSPHNYNFETVEDAIDGMNEILEKWPG